jgi:hypothetical protein
MAAAAAVGQSVSQASRWTAVSVALAPEETGISLEEEMQKAYAEFAAAETGHAGSMTADSLSSLPAVSASVPATVAPEALQDLSAVGSAAAEAVTAAVKELEQVASAYAAQVPVESAVAESVSKSSADAEKVIFDAAPAAVLESPAPSQADPDAVKQETGPLQESVSSTEGAPQAAAPSETVGESVAAEPVAESSEPVAAQASSAILEAPQDLAAMAAAVGGKPVEESSFDTDPAIASIVDSVLANLRPKIVEEISRKLGKK